MQVPQGHLVGAKAKLRASAGTNGCLRLELIVNEKEAPAG